MLKNETKYKYFISTDWDKFIEEEFEVDAHIHNMVMHGFNNSHKEQKKIVEEMQEEDSPINVKTFDLDSIDETTENSISNLDK